MNIELSVFTKFLLIFFTNFLLFFTLSFFWQCVVFIFLCSLFFISGKTRKGVIWSVISFFFIFANYFSMALPASFITAILLFFASGLLKLLPVIVVANYIMSTTKTSQLIFGLKKMRVPEVILIPLCVLLRFFPTVGQDYRQIRNAMKFRGIAVNKWELIKKPIQTIEYIYVPLLNNAASVATDLTSSALTRGITNPAASTSVFLVKFQLVDVLTVLITIGLTGGIWIA